MSAILSADTLNDYISPSLECIKPVETLPQQIPTQSVNAYEVTTEDTLPSNVPPAQISLTDCLACSGCVTSAEAVLVSLQSHAEVLHALDSNPNFEKEAVAALAESHGAIQQNDTNKRIFVASLSPQVRASLAVTYGTTEREAAHMVEQLLCGSQGLGTGGSHGSKFSWIIDTNAMREVCLTAAADETFQSQPDELVQLPILVSACPGWVCYVEKTHPHVLPHLSKLKSPQALTGIILKSILSKKLGINPSQIFHLAIMPCFDKKLEGSRQELTNKWWQPGADTDDSAAVRDVDCVITAREILMLAESRGISFPSLPKTPVSRSTIPVFPDKTISDFFFSRRRSAAGKQTLDAGTSGGYLYHILKEKQRLHPGSTIQCQKGRNSDVVDYTVNLNDQILFRASRYYGFRNIQNLVRKLRPAKVSKLSGRTIGARKPGSAGTSATDYAYVEVMACPGGCTNGGGQIKLDDLGTLQGKVTTAQNQKEWNNLVDEAYYSMDEEDVSKSIGDSEDQDTLPIDPHSLIEHWSSITNIPAKTLLRTTFREVQSDVGKPKKLDTERVAEIATKLGGGW